jgi:hypothetical protein
MQRKMLDDKLLWSACDDWNGEGNPRDLSLGGVYILQD